MATENCHFTYSTLRKQTSLKCRTLLHWSAARLFPHGLYFAPAPAHQTYPRRLQ
jgi:hypothetical protein